jgi:low temperature requirement protein LtrA
MFGVMGAFLVAALAVPEAFGDSGVLFGVSFAIARWLHIFIFAEANEDIAAAQAIRRLARTALPAPILLIVAGFLDGSAQTALWLLALAIDFAGPYAERFGLIVIIALGESIVAIGAGVDGALDAGIVVSALLGLIVVCALWWATST